MDKFLILILVLGTIFLVGRIFSWVSWEAQKRIFFRGVGNFLQKEDEEQDGGEKKGK